MITYNRRRMMGMSAGLCLTASPFARCVSAEPAATRRFTKDLSWAAIGVRADQRQAIEYAARFGFESVYADAGYLTRLDDAQREALLETMHAKQIVWGAAGLPVEFRKDEDTFRRGLKQLPQLALGLQQAGVTRVGTWLRPFHAELTYVQNFRQHARRLRECVKILADHGQSFGMEYVGPKTLWSSSRYSFIHSMAETRDLIAEIGQDNVGFVLDSWHWYTAHETVDDLRSLTRQEIVACDLNDAPQGIEVDAQIDSRRELPAATGVIDLKTFLSTLQGLGYDGPVRAEPFNAALNAMENEAACQATSQAIDRAFALIAE